MGSELGQSQSSLVRDLLPLIILNNKEDFIDRDPCPGVLVNNSLLIGTLSNVRRCWLAMPVGAGILRWVFACHKIEKQTKKVLDFN